MVAAPEAGPGAAGGRKLPPFRLPAGKSAAGDLWEEAQPSTERIGVRVNGFFPLRRNPADSLIIIPELPEKFKFYNRPVLNRIMADRLRIPRRIRAYT